MDIKFKETHSLATFFAENIEKENIISELFEYFKIDCIERCHYNPSHLDNLIRQFYKDEKCDIKILESIIDCIKTGRENIKKKENDLIKTIVSYIEDNLTEDFSIEQIATDLSISYYYMCHIFKDRYNISVNTFKTQKRLEKSMKALLQTDKKISDIASLCGFNNTSYFTEIFTKNVGISPSLFRTKYSDIYIHDSYNYDDILMATKLNCIRFTENKVAQIPSYYKYVSIHIPDDTFKFLHEAAIIEYKGCIYVSWYNCPEKELQGYTPICGRRSYDKGKTWTDLEIICEDKSGKILYCPPVYGICDDKLYMFVNQMVAPDHMHSLDLYVLNEETDKFEFLWSEPVPFKLNTNVVRLPNGKLLLPGRIGELDGFPNTPAVLISDSGKIDAEWRLVKIAENGNLPNGKELIHPEISVICAENVLYMFCRNDKAHVPLVYISKDFGETWSDVCSHDIPIISSKLYCGDLTDGRHYLVCNTDKINRTKVSLYITDDDSKNFTKKIVLFDTDKDFHSGCHYPAACEYDNHLYIIATQNYEGGNRGALLFKINLSEI